MYWRSLLPDELKVLVHAGVSRYLELYKECSKGTDKNSKLYLNWLEYERSLVCKSLQSSKINLNVDSILETYV